MEESSMPIPEEGHPRWKEMIGILKRILHVLISHDDSVDESTQEQDHELAANRCQFFNTRFYLCEIIKSMQRLPPQLQSSPEWSPACEKLWDDVLFHVKLAARWLSRDGSRDPMTVAMKEVFCPNFAEEEVEFGEEINRLADMLLNITG